ncbi:MAG TPA: hypoxanthine phosphoribosyltransferase [Acidimicrobiales bacterium]
MLAGPDELRATVARLGAAISEAHPEGVVLVGLLKGSLIFLADLARALTVDVTVEFLAVTSYERGSGRVRLVLDLGADVTGRAVVLVEDVVDTGLTLAYLLAELERRSAASVEVCALADRRSRRIVPVRVDWVGFEVGDEFLVGYGVDHAGRYRNLRLLAAADAAALDADPDAYVSSLYGMAREGRSRG